MLHFAAIEAVFGEWLCLKHPLSVNDYQNSFIVQSGKVDSVRRNTGVDPWKGAILTMSPRQFVLTLTCLLGACLATTEISAQGQDKSPSRQKGGFIQQLRSLPSQALQTLEAAESGYTPLPSPAQYQRFPPQPSGRATLQRTHQSPWLERLSQSQPPSSQPSMPQSVQRLRNDTAVPQTLSDRPKSVPVPPSRQGFSLSDRQTTPEPTPDTYNGVAEDFRSAPIGLQKFKDEIQLSNTELADRSQPELYKSEARLTPKPILSEPLAVRRSSTEAVAPEALQQAPRVSRVPLPGTAVSSRAQANEREHSQTEALPKQADSSNASGAPSLAEEKVKAEPTESTSRPPARISATSTSASLGLGSQRLSSAQLTNKLDPSRGEAVSVPTALPSRPMAERNPSDELPLPSKQGAEAVGGEAAIPPLPPTSLALPAAPGERVAPESESQPGPATSRLSDSSDSQKPTLEEPQSNFAVSRRVPQLETPRADYPSLSFELPSQTAQPTEPRSNAYLGDSQATSAAPGLASPSTALAKPSMPSVEQGSLNTPNQRVKLETPHVQVALNGPSNLPIGAPALYEVVVHNIDQIDMQGLILRLDIPPGIKVQTLKPTHGEFEVEKAADGLTMLTWGFEYLPAGQSATAPMQLIASTAKNFAVAMEWTLMPVSATSDIEVRAPRLELALEGPAEVNFGQPNVYHLHVRNPGNARASQIAVRLSAEPYGSSTAEIPAVEPGEEEVIDVELTFNEQGAIRISADAQEQSGLASETAISVIVRQAKLSAQIAAPQVVYHGGLASYQVQLTNSGDADATDLQATFDLPEGASLIAAPTGASSSGRKLTWPVSKLAAGSSEAFAIQLKLTGAGQNQIQFVCAGAGILKAAAQATTQVESISDLKLIVSDPIAPAPVGGEVVYELTLTNRGSKAATNVKVIAQFSEGIEPVRCEGHPSRVVPGQSFFEPISKIGAGETVSLKVFAKAEVAGTHRFRVEVRADETEVRLVQEESTQYLDAAGRIASPPANSLMR